MKCKYCGGEVSLSEKYCPYCGRRNEQTAAHAEAMRKYRKDYAETKASVEEKTRRFGITTASAVVIAVLSLLLVLAIFAAVKAWDLRYAFQKRDAERHVAEYTEILNDYLENGQYIEYYEFADQKGVTNVYRDAYKEHRLVLYAASQYEYFYRALTDILTEKKLDYAMTWTSSLNSAVSGFFEDVEEYRTRDDGEYRTALGDKAVEGMEHNIRILLDTYLGIGDEEMAAYLKGAAGKRLSMIEDAVEAMFGGDAQ